MALTDGGQKLQIYAKKDQLPDAISSCTSCWISVTSSVSKALNAHGRTDDSGKELTFLAKSFLPLPEKWHG